MWYYLGITHTAVVPLDLVKCRLQVDPDKYKNVMTGFKVSVREEGMRGLAKGWAPTFIGYSLQVIYVYVISNYMEMTNYIKMLITVFENSLQNVYNFSFPLNFTMFCMIWFFYV